MRLSQDNRIGDGSRRNYRWTFERHVFRQIGEMPADGVTPEDIIAIFDALEERGPPRRPIWTKAAMAQTYKWGLKRRRVSATRR